MFFSQLVNSLVGMKTVYVYLTEGKAMMLACHTTPENHYPDSLLLVIYSEKRGLEGKHFNLC